jgi:hypothetical protein
MKTKLSNLGLILINANVVQNSVAAASTTASSHLPGIYLTFSLIWVRYECVMLKRRVERNGLSSGDKLFFQWLARKLN